MPPKKSSTRFLARASGASGSFQPTREVEYSTIGGSTFSATSEKSSRSSIIEKLGDPSGFSTPPVIAHPRGTKTSGTANMILGADTPCLWRGRSRPHVLLYYIGCVLSLGILYVVTVIYPHLFDWIVLKPVSPEKATTASVLIDGEWESGAVEIRSAGAYGSKVAVTEIKCQRYTAYSSKAWKLFAVADVPAEFPQMVLAAGGAVSRSTDSDRDTIELLYGPNKMSLPEVDFCAILVRQILHPFYLFQYFAVIVWVVQDYVMYSIVILLITGSAIYMTATELVFNLKQLHNLAGDDHTISVVDLAKRSVIPTPDSLLVPGDLVALQPGLVLPCDVLLTSGRVTVDESMLTGESVPVTKTPVDMNMISSSLLDGGAAVDFSKYPGSILFGGTHILQASGGAAEIAEGNPVGIVFKTGFRSAKGQLVATLLNPKEEFMGFFSDALNVVLFMFLLATTLFIWTGANLRGQNASWGLVFMKYLDAITIAVPPALTASLTVATTISIGRLRKKGIFVSETSRVNWAGICGAACFDKTGTLTEERLVFERAHIPLRMAMFLEGDTRGPAAEEDVWESVHGGVSHGAGASASALDVANMSTARGPLAEDLPRVCLELMATCHSLALVDGDPKGDPLEVELLRASGWALSNEANSPHLLVFSGPASSITRHHILRHFEFTADKMRAGTLMRRPTGELLYLIKGSPEVILRLVKQSSTPGDVETLLESLASDGLRVIAMGFHDFGKVDENSLLCMSQEELESDIDFLGLLSMSNALKADTKATIATLLDAEIRSNMITGDHVQTAISISYKCGLLTKTRPLFLLDTDDRDFLSASNISDVSASGAPCLSDPRAIPTSVSGVVALIKREVEEYSSSIPQLAISGKGMVALRSQNAEYVADVVRSTQVFARMKPSDKQFIVEELMKNSEEEIHRLDESVSSKQDSSHRLLGRRTELSSSLDFLSQHGPRRGKNKFHYSQKRLGMLDDSTRSIESVEEGGGGVMPLYVDNTDSAERAPDSTLETLTSVFQDAVDDTIKSGRGKLHVVFCGDGANDMSALRAATVGVSLCEAETSVAAPVTSRLQTPHAVVDVLKEGRCSLVTAYVLITFNIMYAVIQLFMVCMMYNFGLRVGDMTYLIQDLFFTLVLGLAIAITPPEKKLDSELPPQKFFTPYFCFKLVSQLICFPAFQLIALKVLEGQNFYDKYDSNGDPLVDTYAYETSAIANMGLAQLMIASVVATVDHPFRMPWYNNMHHVGLLTVQGIFLLYQIFSRGHDFLENTLEIKPLPIEFCFILCAIIAANGVVSLLLSRFSETLRAKPFRSLQ